MRTARLSFEQSSPESHELNLVPYLDVMINLVMFLIVSVTFVTPLQTIEIAAPPFCSGCPGQVASFEPQLNLDAEGALLQASDGSVPAIRLGLREGALDTVAITETLRDWKERFHLGEHLTVSASPEVQYQVVVAALDAAREDDGAALFPEVMLGIRLVPGRGTGSP